MSDDLYGIVYLIKNKVNNKKYIGITTEKRGFKGRYKSKGEGIERVYGHLENSKKYGDYYNEHLFRAIEKYGFDNFDVVEIFDKAYSKNELLKKERKWILHFQSNEIEKGYNKSNGGEGLYGSNRGFESKLKRKRTNAEFFNITLNSAYVIRLSMENPFLLIWDVRDGLNKDGKKLLYDKLQGAETKNCIICGIEYYKSGKGGFCKSCGKTDFLDEYKIYSKKEKDDYKVDF